MMIDREFEKVLATIPPDLKPSPKSMRANVLLRTVMASLRPFKGTSATTLLSDCKMQGLLEKKCNNKRILQINQYTRRYVILDFIQNLLLFKHYDKDDHANNSTEIKFEDILACDNIIAYKQTNYVVKSKPYNWQFNVNTKNREYCLYTTSEQERYMWMTCFECIVDFNQKRFEMSD